MQAAQRALNDLNKVAPGSVLAGGYLRDITLGAPVKDLDFFSHSALTLAELKTVFPDADLEPFSTFVQYSSEEVKAVYTIGTIGGLPGQVIVLRDGISPYSRISHFDFGFCQIGTDGHSGTTYTPAFAKDQAENTATLIYCENANEFTRSMKRWARLQRKYPDRQLVIPEEFQKWMQLPA